MSTIKDAQPKVTVTDVVASNTLSAGGTLILSGVARIVSLLPNKTVDRLHRRAIRTTGTIAEFAKEVHQLLVDELAEKEAVQNRKIQQELNKQIGIGNDDEPRALGMENNRVSPETEQHYVDTYASKENDPNHRNYPGGIATPSGGLPATRKHS